MKNNNINRVNKVQNSYAKVLGGFYFISLVIALSGFVIDSSSNSCGDFFCVPFALFTFSFSAVMAVLVSLFWLMRYIWQKIHKQPLVASASLTVIVYFASILLSIIGYVPVNLLVRNVLDKGDQVGCERRHKDFMDTYQFKSVKIKPIFDEYQKILMFKYEIDLLSKKDIAFKIEAGYPVTSFSFDNLYSNSYEMNEVSVVTGENFISGILKRGTLGGISGSNPSYLLPKKFRFNISTDDGNNYLLIFSDEENRVDCEKRNYPGINLQTTFIDKEIVYSQLTELIKNPNSIFAREVLLSGIDNQIKTDCMDGAIALLDVNEGFLGYVSLIPNNPKSENLCTLSWDAKTIYPTLEDIIKKKNSKKIESGSYIIFSRTKDAITSNMIHVNIVKNSNEE